MPTASVSDFHFLSTCSGRRLKFGFSVAILAVTSFQTLFFLQFTFLKSFSCSLYWEISSKMSSLLHQKPFLLSTASTLHTNTTPAETMTPLFWLFRLFCSQEQNIGNGGNPLGFWNENSSRTNAYSHYSNYSYSRLSQTNAPLKYFKMIPILVVSFPNLH